MGKTSPYPASAPKRLNFFFQIKLFWIKRVSDGFIMHADRKAVRNHKNATVTLWGLVNIDSERTFHFLKDIWTGIHEAAV